jgi:hypothetical protein
MNLISSVEICSLGRFSFKKSEPSLPLEWNGLLEAAKEALQQVEEGGPVSD